MGFEQLCQGYNRCDSSHTFFGRCSSNAADQQQCKSCNCNLRYVHHLVLSHPTNCNKRQSSSSGSTSSVCVCVCVCVCVRVCMHACVCACVCVWFIKIKIHVTYHCQMITVLLHVITITPLSKKKKKQDHTHIMLHQSHSTRLSSLRMIYENVQYATLV